MSKIPITITLYMSEILYDIQNKTYLTGRSRETEKDKTAEQVSHMQASDDDEDLNQILRSLGNAEASVKTKLAEYMDDETNSGDNILINENDNTMRILLAMPSNFNMSATKAISTQLHQFIVNMAVYDWFTITNKSDAEGYLKMAAANIEQIREAINKRVRPQRRNAGSPDSRFDPAPTCATPTIKKIGNLVHIECVTTGAVIRYTTDGSVPTQASTLYTEPIGLLLPNVTFKAYATKSGMYDSAIATYQVTE